MTNELSGIIPINLIRGSLALHQELAHGMESLPAYCVSSKLALLTVYRDLRASWIVPAVRLPHSEELPHLLPPRPHHLLVLADAQLLAVDDAGALGPGLVLVVGILLQVDLAEPCLLFIIRLFLLVRHGLPARSC